MGVRNLILCSFHEFNKWIKHLIVTSIHFLCTSYQIVRLFMSFPNYLIDSSASKSGASIENMSCGPRISAADALFCDMIMILSRPPPKNNMFQESCVNNIVSWSG